MLIPDRKVMPRREGTIWKVLGSNPSVSKVFILMKSVLKSTCMIIMVWIFSIKQVRVSQNVIVDVP